MNISNFKNKLNHFKEYCISSFIEIKNKLKQELESLNPSAINE